MTVGKSRADRVRERELRLLTSSLSQHRCAERVPRVRRMLARVHLSGPTSDNSVSHARAASSSRSRAAQTSPRNRCRPRAGNIPGARACAAHPSRRTSRAASKASRAMRTVATSQWVNASPGSGRQRDGPALIRTPPQLTCGAPMREMPAGAMDVVPGEGVEIASPWINVRMGRLVVRGDVRCVCRVRITRPAYSWTRERARNSARRARPTSVEKRTGARRARKHRRRHGKRAGGDQQQQR